MSTKHYIAMAGLHGCIPNTCEVYPNRQDAIQSLIDLHELKHTHYAGELRRNNYVELDLHKHGNEYAEVDWCDCNDPSQHSDSGEVDW